MAKMKKSVTGTSPIWQVCTYAVLLLVVLVAVFPAIWMLSTSIKLPTEQYDIPPQIIPDTPTISNYVNVLTNSKMYQAFVNSVIITVCVVAVTLFISILAGYGLSRYKFKGHGVLKIALLLDVYKRQIHASPFLLYTGWVRVTKRRSELDEMSEM